MSVFAKLGDFKRPDPTSFSMNYTEIKAFYSDEGRVVRLKQTGLSANGINQIKNGLALSDPEDRRISAGIIAAVLG